MGRVGLFRKSVSTALMAASMCGLALVNGGVPLITGLPVTMSLPTI